MKKVGQFWQSLLTGDRKIRILVLLGLLGMLLILLSHFWAASGEEEPPADTTTAEFTTEQYIADLERKLEGLMTGIEGVGKARVMVTLESGVEYLYLQEEKRGLDTSREERGSEEAGRVYSKENVEQKYILVEQNGQKQPVLRTELQPKIQGVVIVCEGAGDIRVRQNLTNVVTTALNIPSTRVCVVKIDTTESINMQEETQ